jgi:hypothetical protein
MEHFNLKLCGRIDNREISLCLININHINKITNEIIIPLRNFDQIMDHFQKREDTSQGQQHIQIRQMLKVGYNLKIGVHALPFFIKIF